MPYMADLKNVLDQAMDLVRPTERQTASMKRRVDAVTEKLESALKGKDADIFIGGSYGKGTWLPGADVDVFVRFNPRYKNISDLLGKAVMKAFPKAKRVKGSRDYFQIRGFEFIPICRISKNSEARNITDFSPLHVDFVTKFLDNADEVRLLKAFCKAHGVYGAETHNHAFSGYVLELLTIAYGGFVHTLDELSNRQPKIHIDFGVQHDISGHKLKSPVIIHDPVQPGRNAAAALSYRNFYRFIYVAKRFLDEPSIEFFRDQTPTIQDIRTRSRRRGTKLFTRRLKAKGISNIFFAKLAKNLARIKSRCEANGFAVYDYGFVEAKKHADIYFEFSTLKTCRTRRHFGPPLHVDEHINDFIQKWESNSVHGPYVWENKIAVDVEKETDPLVFVKGLVDEL
jgi:tRNA nucleotidyltransferase (CCA-adding enzyme)